MELKDLYMTKGELVTKLEILQGQLGQVNQLIEKELNKPQPIKDVKEKKEVK